MAGAAAAIVAGQWLVTLPLGAHSEAVLRDYGISTQSWAGWLRDRAVGLLVSLAVTVLAMLLLWWLTRRAPRRWPWLLAGIAAAVTVVASTLYPLVVESLYTHVTPLPAGPLRTSIEQLAARDGLGDVRVVVSNASSRTTGENAAASRVCGATRRVALDDTLVARARTDPAAVLVVVAHELGHVRNQDVARGTAIAALAVPTGVLLLSWVLTSAGARRVFRPQATAPRQVVRSVALVLAITSTAPLLAAPVTNLVSRRIEAAADLHALQRTGDVAAFERIQHDLATSNLIRLRSPGGRPCSSRPTPRRRGGSPWPRPGRVVADRPGAKPLGAVAARRRLLRAEPRLLLAQHERVHPGDAEPQEAPLRDVDQALAQDLLPGDREPGGRPVQLAGQVGHRPPAPTRPASRSPAAGPAAGRRPFHRERYRPSSTSARAALTPRWASSALMGADRDVPHVLAGRLQQVGVPLRGVQGHVQRGRGPGDVQRVGGTPSGRPLLPAGRATQRPVVDIRSA